MQPMSRQAQEVLLWRAQAKRWQGQATRLEADNAQLRTKVAELEAKVDALSEQLAVLARVAFGGSTEKVTLPTPRDGAGSGHSLDAAGTPSGARGRRGRGQQPGGSGHGRRDYSSLPTVQVVDAVAEAERVCPRCGQPYAPMGRNAPN